MYANRYKLVVMVCSAFVLVGDSSGLAAGVRWDFAGTLSSVSGLGTSQPGASVGATVTGSITLADAVGVYVSSSYPYWAGGTTTVFGGAYCQLDYTVASGGVLDHYTAEVSSLDMQITSNPSSEDNYHFWGGAGTYRFQLEKIGPGIQRPGNFSGFLDGISGGLGDGSGTFTLAEGSWGNSVNGYLTSLTQTIIPVPEPSAAEIIGSGALLFFIRHMKNDLRKKTRISSIG